MKIGSKYHHQKLLIQEEYGWKKGCANLPYSFTPENSIIHYPEGKRLTKFFRNEAYKKKKKETNNNEINAQHKTISLPTVAFDSPQKTLYVNFANSKELIKKLIPKIRLEINMNPLKQLTLIFPNKIALVDLKPLQKILQSLRLIERIELNFSNYPSITKVHLGEILKSIRYLVNLKHISLKHEYESKIFTNKDSLRELIARFANIVKRLPKLEQMPFISNSIANILLQTYLFIKVLQGHKPSFFENMKSFSLDVSGARLYHKEVLFLLYHGINHLPPTIENLSTDLSFYEMIYTQDLIAIIEKLKPYRQLKKLTLNFGLCGEAHQSTSSNKKYKTVNNKVLHMLSETLKYLTKLEEISLDFDFSNTINHEGVEPLGEGLSSLKNIKKIKLSFGYCNHFGRRSLPAIAKTLENLINLEYVDLDFSNCRKIKDNGIEALAKAFTMLPQLKEIKLNLSELNMANSLEIIAKNLKKLPNLQALTLDFSHCQEIYADKLQIFGQVLTQLSRLKILDLAFNECLITEAPLKRFLSQIEILLKKSPKNIVLRFQGPSLDLSPETKIILQEFESQFVENKKIAYPKSTLSVVYENFSQINI